MDDNGDIYYVDTRNADPRDHRVGVAVRSPMSPTRAVVVPSASAGRVTYAGPTPVVYAQPPVYAQAPIYAQPPAIGQQPLTTVLGTLFGGINLGQVIDLIGQGFAAAKALPAAPACTGEVVTDIANLTLYQQALAEHGKLDERIRTGVHIVGKLLGA